YGIDFADKRAWDDIQGSDIVIPVNKSVRFLGRNCRCKLEIVGDSRYRINLNTKVRNVKGMNNIFRNDVETNGFINRDHNIGALYIVPSTLIREIYTVGVHRSSQLIVTFTELAVITWITHLPLELLS